MHNVKQTKYIFVSERTTPCIPSSMGLHASPMCGANAFMRAIVRYWVHLATLRTPVHENMHRFVYFPAQRACHWPLYVFSKHKRSRVRIDGMTFSLNAGANYSDGPASVGGTYRTNIDKRDTRDYREIASNQRDNGRDYWTALCWIL